MGFKEIINKFSGDYEDKPEERKDKYLDSLRRQRQRQLEEMEKARLKKTIANYERNRITTGLFGLKKQGNFNNKGFSKGKKNRSRKKGCTWLNKTNMK